MKRFSLFCVVLVVAAVNGQGFPTRKCPPGEHSVLYCPQRAEPDCENPEVHDSPDIPKVCDVPQCFCDAPTVRNKANGKCVERKNCPGKC